MKLADIRTDTVIYAVADHGGTTRYRVVVLDTDRWRAVPDRDAPNSYVLAPLGPTERGISAYSERAGLLTLQAGGWRIDPDTTSEITDDDLLDLAAKAAVDIAEGAAPVLPDGVSVRLMRPADIDGPWGGYVARIAAATKRREREDATRAARAAVQAAARDRLRARVGPDLPASPASGLSWTQLEAICMAYAAPRVPADG